MTAKDFILSSSYELQEKSKDKKFWEDTELFIKLQRAYKTLQNDLPCFIANENIEIKEGISLYNLKHISIKGVSFFVNNKKYIEQEKEYIFQNLNDEKIYNLSHKELTVYPLPKANNNGIIAYYYIKELTNENDFITTPIEYEEALRLIYLSYVFEKAPKNSNERDLAIHYLKRYTLQVDDLKKKKSKKSSSSSYQRI